MPPLTFGQADRLKTPPQFDAVFAGKRSASDGVLVVFAGPDPGPGVGRPRLGLSVSRKVGNAVVRNRWKRLLREAFRHARADLPAGDYVVVPRKGLPAVPPQEQVRASFARLAADAAKRVQKAAKADLGVGRAGDLERERVRSPGPEVPRPPSLPLPPTDAAP